MRVERAGRETIHGWEIKVALKELERLTGELEELAVLLKAETRPQARRVIMERVQEIVLVVREKGSR